MKRSIGFGATWRRRSFVRTLGGAFLSSGFLEIGSGYKGADMPEEPSMSAAKAAPKARLKWEMLVAPSVPVVTTDLAPGEKERPWPPISSTLIYGDRDAVVVDSFITLGQARAQADWIAASGKNLTTIYATHGHGDHFFGATVLLDRFPRARFVAVASAIQVMKQQTSPEFLASFWKPRFPDQIPGNLIIADELGTNVLELEGERLIVIPLLFTDTAGTTCLHVPSLDLIAAGDAAYNGVHPRLVESNENHKRDEWIAALDKMDALKPRVVVAGHKNPKSDDDGSRVVSATRRYILDFEELAEKTTGAKALYDAMLARYPDWLNRGALWSSAIAAKH
jgi:glyoxylase-like metal-dependent hydrolase (beta-lactamase superfamily II)